MDLYVLCAHRDLETIDLFRRKWLHGAEEVAASYLFPEFDDEAGKEIALPILLELLIENPHQPYRIYWGLKDERFKTGMMFFTDDGGLIVGLGLVYWEESEPARFLEKFEQEMEGRCSLMFFETPPPDSISEFMQLAGHSE